MFIGNIASSFQRLSGFNVITFYSTQMFISNGQETMAPYLTLLIGFAMIWPTLITPYFMKKGRRPLLIGGYGVLGGLHAIVGVFILLEINFIAQVVVIMFWAMIYNLAIGPATWVFLSEICSGKAMSI